MPIEKALSLAEEHDLDLVEVAPSANPPVCRLMDYGKYLYEKQKRERESRKSQKQIEIKEVRLRPTPDRGFVRSCIGGILPVVGWTQHGDVADARGWVAAASGCVLHR